MAAFTKVNKSSRFLVRLLSIVTFVAISIFVWVGLQEQSSIRELRHIMNFDLKAMELGGMPANISLPLEIKSHIKNNIQTSLIIYSVIRG
jgi:hypothetical protein